MAVQATPNAQIESVARRLPPDTQDDFRTLMTGILANSVAQAPGGILLRPGGTPAGAGTAPVGVQASISGANGVFTVTFVNPAGSGANQTIYNEVSYSPLQSFTQNVTTLPATTGPTVSVPAPGATYFFRWRSSYDQKTWSAYKLIQASAVSAGLVESSAISSGAAFNQTNFAEVNSQASGTSAISDVLGLDRTHQSARYCTVTISGTGGPLSSLVAQKGVVQSVRPSATVAGVAPGSEQFVGWDGSQYQLQPTLASVLADNLEPIGKVSVVSTATPTLPVIQPVISGGYVIGFHIVSGGAGASQPYTLTFGSVGGGAGATFGQQTIVAGVLVSVGPGDPGNGAYSGGTTVTASGGTGGGTSGGGTAVGGNGGRMTAV
jgi:hypothetical protein